MILLQAFAEVTPVDGVKFDDPGCILSRKLCRNNAIRKRTPGARCEDHGSKKK